MVVGDELGELGAPLDAARLQPDSDPEYAWADDAEERRRAAKIDRLAADRQLISELRQHRFDGEVWDAVATELVKYGLAVTKSWILRGTMFEKCAQKGRPVTRPPRGSMDEDEAESLAGELITVALERFRAEVLVPGRWDPERGAALTTYFVGQCILRFPNLYRTWLTTVADYDLHGDELLHARPSSNSLEDDIIDERANVEALRAVKSADARKALVLSASGYTYAEIGHRLGKSEKAVERMVDYARRQVHKAERGIA